MAENCVLEREAAVRMFVALGFKAAPRWPNERLTRKLAAVPAIVEEDLLPDDEDAAATLVEVLDAAEKGKSFVLSDGKATESETVKPVEPETDGVSEVEAVEESEVETVEAPKPKKAKSKKAKSKSTTEKDDFGLRIGTQGSAICACLTDTPKKMKQLMEEAGQRATFYNLMRKLVADGKVVRTADGFRRA